MPERGEVKGAAYIPQGGNLTADVAVGALTLNVDNPVDFDDAGGTLDLNGDRIDYETVDDDGNITLSTAAPNAAKSGDRVSAVRSGQILTDYIAYVSLGDGDEVEVEIPFAQIDLWPEGEYDDPVLVELSDDLETITRVPGWTPSRDLSFATPGTIPDLNPVTAPASSPAIVVHGTAETLVVGAATTDTTTKIEYHISTTDGFTPDATTLLTTTPSKVYVVTTLPNGTPLALDTVYYLRTVATNAAGSAPPGTQISGSLDPSQVSEIALAKVVSGLVMAGRIEVGNGYWDPNEGLVLPQPNGATTRLSNDGVTQSQIAGYANLDGATVNDNLNLYGLTQEFGTLRLTNGVSDPAVKAGMAREWDSVTWALGAPANHHGFTDNSAGTDWVTAFIGFGVTGLTTINKSTGAVTDAGATRPWQQNFYPNGGITRIGTSYYVLGYDNNRAGAWYVYQLDSSFNKGTGLGGSGEMFVTSSFAHRPAIGTDGTSVLIARVSSGGLLKSFTYSTSTGAQTASLDLTAPSSTADLGGVFYGVADFGGTTNRWIVAADGGAIWAFDSTGARVTTHEFPNAGSSKVRGLHWDGTRFRHLDDAGRLWDYATGHVSTATWYGGYTWFDNDTTGATAATHETKVSPAASFSWPARTRLVISGKPAPDVNVTDPTKVDKANLLKIFAGSSSGAMRVQNGDAPLALGVTDLSIESPDTASRIAPTATNFDTAAAAAPGVLESAAVNGSALPHLQVKGDGSVRAAKLMQSGQWGSGAFTAAGSANEKTTTITFDPPFDATPTVMCTPATDPATGSVWATAVSTTGCTLHAYRITGTAGIGVNWIAVARTQ